MPQDVLEWGIALILILQGLGDWLIVPMNALTFTGNIEFYLLILPALYWCYDRRLGLRVGAALMLSIGFNSMLKIAIHDPRPYWLDARVRLLGNPERTFGIPSGHSQNTVVLWGMLAAHVRRGWFWLLAVMLMALVGLSRMYLGVHFPTDVFAGWLLGWLLLVVFFRFEQPLTNWGRAASLGQLSVLLFLVSLAMILLGAITAVGVEDVWQLPAAWPETVSRVTPDSPIAPFSLDDLIVSAAAFFGLLSGGDWLERRGGFDPGGPWLPRLGRYLVGLVGVILLWQGLGLLFDLLAADETVAGYVLRYVRYSIIAIWVSALAPVTFLRLGLASATND